MGHRKGLKHLKGKKKTKTARYTKHLSLSDIALLVFSNETLEVLIIYMIPHLSPGARRSTEEGVRVQVETGRGEAELAERHFSSSGQASQGEGGNIYHLQLYSYMCTCGETFEVENSQIENHFKFFCRGSNLYTIFHLPGFFPRRFHTIIPMSFTYCCDGI